MSLRTLCWSLMLLVAASAASTAQVEDVRAAFKRGVELVQAGRLDEAEAVFRALDAKSPGLPEVHYNLGYIAQRRGDGEAAAAAYAKAFQLKPGYSQAAAALARLRSDTRRRDLERSLAGGATPALTQDTTASHLYVP